MTQSTQTQQERRHGTIRRLEEWWDVLSPAQRVAVYRLGQFGFQLEFVRHSEGDRAYACCSDMTALIDSKGRVEFSNQVVLRH